MIRTMTYYLAVGCVSLSSMMPANHLTMSMINERSTAQGVEISLSVASESRSSIELAVKATNAGSKPVYVMTNPQRADRSSGFYVEQSPNEPALALCTAQLYPPAPFEMYFNGTSLHLLMLKPGETHIEKVVISLPIRTTQPPFSERPGSRELGAAVKHMEAVIGVLPQSEDLDRLLARKVGHDVVTGFETIGGRPLYQLQQLARSAPVEIHQP